MSAIHKNSILIDVFHEFQGYRKDKNWDRRKSQSFFEHTIDSYRMHCCVIYLWLAIDTHRDIISSDCLPNELFHCKGKFFFVANVKSIFTSIPLFPNSFKLF